MRRVCITETVTNTEHFDCNQPYEYSDIEDDRSECGHYCKKTTTITEFYKPLKPASIRPTPPITGSSMQPNYAYHGPLPTPPSLTSTFLPPPPPYPTMAPFISQPEMSINALNGPATIGPEGASQQQPRCQGISNTAGSVPTLGQICPPPLPLLQPIVWSPSPQMALYPDYQRLNACQYNNLAPVPPPMPPMSVPQNRSGFISNANAQAVFASARPICPYGGMRL